MFSVKSSRNNEAFQAVIVFDLSSYGYQKIRTIEADTDEKLAKQMLIVLYPRITELIDILEIQMEKLDRQYENNTLKLYYPELHWKTARDSFLKIYFDFKEHSHQPPYVIEILEANQDKLWSIIPSKESPLVELIDDILKANNIAIRALKKIYEKP